MTHDETNYMKSWKTLGVTAMYNWNSKNQKGNLFNTNHHVLKTTLAAIAKWVIFGRPVFSKRTMTLNYLVHLEMFDQGKFKKLTFHESPIKTWI